MTTDTSEKAFQNDIIVHLVNTGYHKRNNGNYNKASCIDLELTLKFIYDTQPREWRKFQKVYGEQSEQKFFYRLIKRIPRWLCLGVRGKFENLRFSLRLKSVS